MISVDPDQMPQNAMSDQGLHCLPYIPVGPYFYNEVMYIFNFFLFFFFFFFFVSVSCLYVTIKTFFSIFQFFVCFCEFIYLINLFVLIM